MRTIDPRDLEFSEAFWLNNIKFYHLILLLNLSVSLL